MACSVCEALLAELTASITNLKTLNGAYRPLIGRQENIRDALELQTTYLYESEMCEAYTQELSEHRRKEHAAHR